MATTALIPFSTRIEDELAGHIARGLSLELSDWLATAGIEPIVINRTQTEEDGAWSKLVNFTDELTPENVSDFIFSLRGDNTEEGPEFQRVISGIIDQIDGAPVGSGLHLAISVTDVAGGFLLGRFTADLSPQTFRDSIIELFKNVADVLGDASSAYDPLTNNYQAWLNLMITRALTLAAGVGAMARDAQGVFSPALEALRLDPHLTAARDRLTELAQVMVLERGFPASEAVKALESAVARTGPDWRSLRARGHLMLAGGEYSQAAKAFCQVLSGKHEAPEKDERLQAALFAGKAFNLASRPAEAQRVLSVAMQAENLRVDAIVESAASSASLGEHVVAERLWLRALELEPQSIAARLHLARMHRSSGDNARASEQYRELIKIPGLPREVFADIVEFFIMNRMLEQALMAAERHADEYPGDAIAHVLMASTLNSLGKHKRAIKALDHAELCTGVEDHRAIVTRQRRYAEHPEAEERFRRWANESIAGNAENALLGMIELLETYPDFTEARLFRGIALRRLERWDEARDVLVALREINNFPGIDKELTGIYSMLNQPDKALEHAKLALDATPEDPTLLTNYAAALLECGRIDDAARYAARAESVIPDDEATRKLIELIKLRMEKRGVLRNFAATIKEATSWFRRGKADEK